MSSIKRDSTSDVFRFGENFLYGFKGAPSARQADRPWPRLAKDAQDEHGEREPAGRRAIAARR